MPQFRSLAARVNLTGSYAARLNLRNQRNPVTPSYGPREWLGWVFAARLNLLFLIFDLFYKL
ncbi:hypothetical protein Hanom_Chr02g00159041 [Helianthus anomalus]